MGDIAITVQGLSKQYRIGSKQERYKTLRDTLTDAFIAPFRRMKRISQSAIRNPNLDHIWALKDVSFEVKRGEVIGIIGRNGAGKTTLLKILSRITEPTEGYADVIGRVGSLLEVGTGFHPELTGRENIYLNGAILGMKKAEIERKFDEIVAFAEVEKFIDTPVKHYSSGMYVRLAFAVAAHMETDILLVDEVLAVGDAAFQEKCMGAMRETACGGKTVLLVSHNMSSIQHLCNRAILLKSGCIEAIGDSQKVVGHYLSDASTESIINIRDWHDRITTDEARLIRFQIYGGNGKVTNRVQVGESITFRMYGEFYRPFVDPSFGVIVHNGSGEPVLDLRSIHGGFRLGRVEGTIVVEARVENIGLYPGRYFLSPWIMDSACSRDIDFVKLCCVLQVDPAPGPHGDLKLDPIWGKYWVYSDWATVKLS